MLCRFGVMTVRQLVVETSRIHEDGDSPEARPKLREIGIGNHTTKGNTPVSGLCEHTATRVLTICRQRRVGSRGGAVDVRERFAVADCALVSGAGVGLSRGECGEQSANNDSMGKHDVEVESSNRIMYVRFTKTLF